MEPRPIAADPTKDSGYSSGTARKPEAGTYHGSLFIR